MYILASTLFVSDSISRLRERLGWTWLAVLASILNLNCTHCKSSRPIRVKALLTSVVSQFAELGPIKLKKPGLGWPFWRKPSARTSILKCPKAAAPSRDLLHQSCPAPGLNLAPSLSIASSTSPGIITTSNGVSHHLADVLQHCCLLRLSISQYQRREANAAFGNIADPILTQVSACFDPTPAVWVLLAPLLAPHLPSCFMFSKPMLCNSLGYLWTALNLFYAHLCCKSRKLMEIFVKT